MKKYITGLNGLRAIAVLFVIISHRFPKFHFTRSFPLGNYGVDIFFVLSGFLISRILFLQIENSRNGKSSNYIIIKNFILRRAIRIFPLYYSLIFFLYFTKGIIGDKIRDNFLWYFFYCANYLNYTENRWFGGLAHLWSLSVEEQFYIVWPLLLVIVFKNRILILIILAICIGTIYPFFITSEFAKVLTLGCINTFGIGALLAYVEIYKPKHKHLFMKISSILFIPILILICYHNLIVNILFFSERLAISIIAIHIIATCLWKPESYIVSKILSNKVLNFIGVISYGIYLFHNIVPKYWIWALTKLDCETPATHYEFSYLEFIIQTTFIIGLSYLSWILFEKPILKLKEYVK